MSLLSQLPLRRGSDGRLWALALVIAVFVWVLARQAASEQIRLVVPVQVLQADPRIEVQIDPPRIPVVLRYPRELSSQISDQNLRFQVDASDLMAGLGIEWNRKTMPLTQRDFVANLNRGQLVELLQIGQQTNTVQVALRYKARAAAVEPELVNIDKLPPGLQLMTPVRTQPRQLYIVGDDAVLAGVPVDRETSQPVIKTERIDVARYSQSATENVPLRVPAGVELLDNPTRSVEVFLEISEVQTVRVIDGLKIVFRPLAADTVVARYKEKTAQVKLFGPPSLMKQATAENFELVIQRPMEEVPGTSRDVGVLVRWAPSAREELRNRVTIQSWEPRQIRVSYDALPAGGTTTE